MNVARCPDQRCMKPIIARGESDGITDEVRCAAGHRWRKVGELVDRRRDRVESRRAASRYDAQRAA